MSLYPGPVPVSDVHVWKTEATQRLLGYTIALSETEWHAPSALPGWSRAHIATHLARNADYLTAVVRAAAAGAPQPDHRPSDEVRAELESGAERNGLELQIDLDASAGALENAIEPVIDWSPPVLVDGDTQPLSVIPLLRLHEVSAHHLDLDCGFTADGVDPRAAAWLLRWALFRLRGGALPRIDLETDTLNDTVGTGGVQLHVQGTDARVWAWLTGRCAPELVEGAAGLRLPLLG